MESTKIGIIKEEKTPSDKRVPLSPIQCRELLNKYKNVQIWVQKSGIRCFSDEEYNAEGIPVVDELSHCNILMGVKEVPVSSLIPDKKYLFFSHTIKKQFYNRKILKAVLRKNIQLIDYECLKDKNGNRLLGFGRYAGFVGAYNAISGFGLKNKLYTLKRAYKCKDKTEIIEELKKVKLPPVKIVITGGGRVANGALELLSALPIKEIKPSDFLNREYNEPVFCQLHVMDYYKRNDKNKGALPDFFAHPDKYESAFLPYLKKADILITAHFWEPASPVLFAKEDMKKEDFNISLIADITCDIKGSIPSTLKTSTVSNPFYGYDPHKEKTTRAFDAGTVTVMAVDNLPCELPRDASVDFGQDLIQYVIPALLGNDSDNIIERATIAKSGTLTPPFKYLQDYVDS